MKVRRPIRVLQSIRGDVSAYPAPVHCPACQSRMMVTELTCPECDTCVQGAFEAPGLQRLNAEQLQFAEVFLRCRGNIREVERELKISYPTVRSRLDQIIQAMGYSALEGTDDESASRSVTTAALDGLDAGTLSFEDALELLKGDK
ncbi:DUF2089 domain-containing protein [Alicyclobacillus sp. ALC3]|uniref:DUF2089 domain-containing protein n=1 Tax=Alicyclobacillus sp. ALC3 TaxID=2796143 RepID=UPI0023796504|nr:DUF2089 domain-containing protein [Alicyclobacillus sp. ALC3]WDL96259.1 DUF2089 domain-containing protein [Alicyclobacillus sp. ALC3]